MIDHGKQNLLGVHVDAVDYDTSVERVISAARDARPLSVSALAVHGVMTGVLDPVHRYRLNHLDLVVPDGQPVRWALNAMYRTPLRDRVYGPTLMLRVCEQAEQEQLPIFLFGGAEPVLAKLKSRLNDRFPRLHIAGTCASRFRTLSAVERNETVDTIRASGARLTFVGLGCPRQEVWAYEFRDALSMPVLAVGAAFNFHADLLPQAPALLQDCGLEWLFRLLSEPRRLWRRYLLLNPLYTTLVGLQLLRLRTFTHGGVRPANEVLYG